MTDKLTLIDTVNVPRNEVESIDFSLYKTEPGLSFEDTIQACLDQDEVLASFQSQFELDVLFNLINEKAADFVDVNLDPPQFFAVFLGGSHQEGIDLTVDLTNPNDVQKLDYVFLDGSTEGLPTLDIQENWFSEIEPNNENNVERCLSISFIVDGPTGLNDIDCEDDLDEFFGVLGAICSKIVVNEEENELDLVLTGAAVTCCFVFIFLGIILNHKRKRMKQQKEDLESLKQRNEVT